jgi:hypothetical protein
MGRSVLRPYLFLWWFTVEDVVGEEWHGYAVPLRMSG